MQKKHWTTILEFEVIKPTNNMETKGERIKLSSFGEYCPDNSLRGYQLSFLLLHPKNYRAIKIVSKGEVANIIYNK